MTRVPCIWHHWEYCLRDKNLAPHSVPYGTFYRNSVGLYVYQICMYISHVHSRIRNQFETEFVRRQYFAQQTVCETVTCHYMQRSGVRLRYKWHYFQYLASVSSLWFVSYMFVIWTEADHGRNYHGELVDRSSQLLSWTGPISHWSTNKLLVLQLSTVLNIAKQCRTL